MTVHVNTRAYRDLSEIWNYLAAENRDAADRLEEELFAAMRLLGEHPGIGHVRPDVADAGFRFWRVRSYQIAYRIRGSKLAICRVFHSARDVRSIFGRQSPRRKGRDSA